MPQNVIYKPKYLPELKNIANDKSENETESVVHEEKNPLNKVAEMIKGGNIELTKAIEMVHQYNLMIHEGKDIDTVVHEETNQLNKPSKLVHVTKESKQKELYSPRSKQSIEPICRNRICKKGCKDCNGENSTKFKFPCKKCNKNCSNLFNLQMHEVTHAKVKPDVYSCSYCTITFSHKDLAEKHENMHIKRRNENEKRYVDFCEICRKTVSKSYLKKHMLKQHQIEIIANENNEMEKHKETIPEREDLLTNHELMNRTEDINEKIHEEKLSFDHPTEINQCIPKYEEIKVKPVFISDNSWQMETLTENKPALKIDVEPNPLPESIKRSRKAGIFQDWDNYWGKIDQPKKLSKCTRCQESFVGQYAEHIIKCITVKHVHERKNSCSQCDAAFITKRRLLIHIELVHEEKKENVEVPKTKQQKTDKTDLLLLAPHNPSEMITKRQIFDHIYSLKITPGKCRSLDYQKHVLETVLCFKNLTIDKLSEPSVDKLETKVSRLTKSIYGNWRKCGAHRDGLYRRFRNNMQDPFDWVPESVHEEKKDPIEMPKLYKQKSDETDVPLLPLSNSSEFLTKKQIFDDMYSRKITPGMCRTSEYQKIVLETVLSLKKVKLNELSDSSVQKLELKAKGFTNPVYVKWRKNGCTRNGLYKKFQNNMEDPFDWIPELKENL